VRCVVPIARGEGKEIHAFPSVENRLAKKASSTASSTAETNILDCLLIHKNRVKREISRRRRGVLDARTESISRDETSRPGWITTFDSVRRPSLFVAHHSARLTRSPTASRPPRRSPARTTSGAPRAC
jgi:hypothetical protein